MQAFANMENEYSGCEHIDIEQMTCSVTVFSIIRLFYSVYVT
jgi:hypothetical protein